MDEDVIIISDEDIEILDSNEFTSDLSKCFANVPDIANSLLKNQLTLLQQTSKLKMASS